MSAILCWIEAHPGLASWIQAIFSIVAIGIAIWLPARQQRVQRLQENERERANIRHDLQSLREELTVMSEGMRFSIGDIFTSPLPEGIVPLLWRPDVDAYVIYHATTDRIGRIPDQNLRRGIVRTHARLRGLILSFCQNYELLRDLEQAEAEMNDSPNSSYYQGRYGRVHLRLRRLAVGLRSSYETIIKDVDGLIDELDKAIAKLT